LREAYINFSDAWNWKKKEEPAPFYLSLETPFSEAIR